MSTISGPYYTLAETLDVLSVRETELLHAIETGKLQAVALTKSRRMLVVLRDAESRWIGCACCTYRGPLLLSPSAILNLLDGENFRLNTGLGIALEHSGISNWSSTYPFKKPTPHGPLAAWTPKELSELPPFHFGVTPMPIEQRDYVNMLTKMFAQFTELDKTGASPSTIQSLTTPSEDRLILDFTQNSAFARDDLRIPASEIAKLQATDVAETKLSEVEHARGNQLHELMCRVLAAHPGIKAKAAWRLIQVELDGGANCYDRDGIIQAMDADCIQWKSRHGNLNSILWSSFQVQLGRLKRQLAAISDASAG